MQAYVEREVQGARLKIFSSSISHGNEPLLSGNHADRYSISAGVQLVWRMVGSRGTKCSWDELSEAECKFETDEPGRSIQDQFCYRASGRPSAVKEEVSEPPKYDGKCCAGNSNVVATYCSSLLRGLRLHITGMVQDYFSDPVVNGWRLTSDNIALIYLRIARKTEQGLKAGIT